MRGELVDALGELFGRCGGGVLQAGQRAGRFDDGDLGVGAVVGKGDELAGEREDLVLLAPFSAPARLALPPNSPADCRSRAMVLYW